MVEQMTPLPESEKPADIPVDGKGSLNSFDTILWWMMLIIAVLAIPAFAIVVSFSMPNDFLKLITFVVCCWFCTWAGMWLMRKSDLKEFQGKK